MTATTAPAQERGTGAHRGLALLVIASAQLMVVLDATIVNIALPHIKTSLHFSQTGLSWVLNAYTLTFGGLLLLGGRTGDLFGRRRMFTFGVALFALASLLGGFAPDKGFLLAMRALQGAGGAVASPTALSLIAVIFEEGPERNRALGLYAAVSGAGAAIGLILGGVLTDLLSWRWVLFVNAPIGLSLVLAVPFVLPESDRSRGHLDLPGALAATGGMAALVYGFIHAASNGWGTAPTLVSFAVAAVLLALFLYGESRSSQPLMPLRLFSSRPRVGSYLVMLVIGAAVFAMFFFLTQYIQEVKGFSPIRAGLAFLPVSVVIVIMAQVAGALVSRTGPRPFVATGTVVAGLGLLWLSRLSPHSSYAAGVLPGILLIAAGMGSMFVPITMGAVAGVDDSDTGIASAMLNVGQQIGGTIGLSALLTVFTTGFTGKLDSEIAQVRGAHPVGGTLPPALFDPAYTHGADLSFACSSALMGVAFLVALALITVPRSKAES